MESEALEAAKKQVQADFLMGQPSRRVTTAELLRIHGESVATDYNRLMSDEFVAQLAPAAIHKVKPMMYHHAIAGEPVTVHIRAQVLAILINGEGETFFDMSIENFHGLEKFGH